MTDSKPATPQYWDYSVEENVLNDIRRTLEDLSHASRHRSHDLTKILRQQEKVRRVVLQIKHFATEIHEALSSLVKSEEEYCDEATSYEGGKLTKFNPDDAREAPWDCSSNDTLYNIDCAVLNIALVSTEHTNVMKHVLDLRTEILTVFDHIKGMAVITGCALKKKRNEPMLPIQSEAHVMHRANAPRGGNYFNMNNLDELMSGPRNYDLIFKFD